MNFWHQAPFFRLLLPLIAGIITAAFVPFEFSYSMFVISALSLVFVLLSFSRFIYLKYKFRWVYGAFLSLFLFVSGYQLTVERTEKFQSSHYSKIYSYDSSIIAEVAEPLVFKKNSFKTVLEVKAILRDKQWERASGKIISYFRKDTISEKLQYGSVLVFNSPLAEISPPQNPEEFNYQRFLFFHNIYHQTYLKNTDWKLIENIPDASITGLAYRIRNYLMSIFVKYNISGDEYSVASALLLGSREEIDKDLVQAYASSGALHVLSVSGLHVGIIFIILNYVLFFLDKIKHGNIIKTILLLLGLWFYSLLTGLSPSVVRAATMFSFMVIGKATNRNTNIYNILACSAFFLLLINPFLIMEVGFQLSYLAVAGIVFIQPKLNRLWNPNIPYAGKAGNWIIAQVWAITTVSIAAQLVTFPLGLLYFHQFPNYFLFSNLVVIPVSTAVIYFGVLLLVVSPVEIISKYVAEVFRWSVWLLNKSVVLVEKLPYSLLQGISINIVETWLIYILIFLMFAFFIQHKLRFLQYSLSILISLLFYQLYENHFQQKQKKLVVYDINKTSAYDFIDGKENFLIADSSFISDESKILFHVRHYWWDLGLDKNSVYDICQMTDGIKGENIFAKNDFIQFYDKRIAFINRHFQERKTNRKISVDYILLSGSPQISIAQLTDMFDFRIIIMDASNSHYTAGKWMEEANTLGVKSYSVAQSGAFILDL